jgi:AcrR family transcriptional regulator
LSQDNGSSQSGTRDLDVTVASQRRRQILEAARACITEDGVERLTLRKVGERAQVSHATIAYYFKTRRDLIDSALQEISIDFLDVLRQRHLLYGMGDLVELVEVFLNPENETARFVVQMIDAGQHDIELRPTHDEFIRYGRDRIERSIRVAMDMGEFEDREPAQSKERKPKKANGSGPANGSHELPPRASTPAVIEASLMNDPNLTTAARLTLVDTFKSLYQMAADMSKAEARP